jgi:hypothetical protein
LTDGIVKVVTSTPVRFLIRRRINQETITPTKPIMDIVKVEEAVAVFFGSPPEVRYLKPPIINIKKKISPARVVIIWRMLKKRHSKPLIVGTSDNSPVPTHLELIISHFWV